MNVTHNHGPLPNVSEILIDERTAARRLSLSTRSLCTLRQKGELPFVKVGLKTLYDPADLRAWVDRTKVPAAAKRAAKVKMDGATDHPVRERDSIYWSESG